MADSAADIYNDIFSGLGACVLGPGTEEEKMKRVQALFDGLMTKTFVFLEKRLTNTKWTYIAAEDHLTYADFMWAAFYCNTIANKSFPLAPMLQQMVCQYPKLQAYFKIMEKVVSPYVSTREQFPF